MAPLRAKQGMGESQKGFHSFIQDIIIGFQTVLSTCKELKEKREMNDKDSLSTLVEWTRIQADQKSWTKDQARDLEARPEVGNVRNRHVGT